MWRDFGYGLPQWRRKKLFAATIILLLSVGIGANTLIFSFVNTVLLKPLPVRNPQNLFLLQKVRVRQVRPEPFFFYRQFEELTHDRTVVTAVVAEQGWSELSFKPLSTGDSVRLITTDRLAQLFFRVGLTPVCRKSIDRTRCSRCLRYSGCAELSILAVAVRKESRRYRRDNPSQGISVSRRRSVAAGVP